MAAGRPEADSSFPHWVAWGSLCLALLLFFGNTVPAVRERASLRAAESELQHLRLGYEAALGRARTATPASNTKDLQTLLMAIDAIGWTPEELLRHYPPTPPRTPVADATTHADDAAPTDAAVPPRNAPREIDPPMGGDLPSRR